MKYFDAVFFLYLNIPINHPLIMGRSSLVIGLDPRFHFPKSQTLSLPDLACEVSSGEKSTMPHLGRAMTDVQELKQASSSSVFQPLGEKYQDRFPKSLHKQTEWKRQLKISVVSSPSPGSGRHKHCGTYFGSLHTPVCCYDNYYRSPQL